jgi:pimeloyl-ACP methyl ester carboxylesterase
MGKETIIFLHGIVGNKNAFKKEIEMLQGDYQCISYDLYDVRDSEVDGLPIIDVFMEQLYCKFVLGNVKKAHLCALSFGSIIAQAFANKYPERVASMTFVGGYCCNEPSQFSENLIRVLEDKGKSDYKMWLKQYATLLNPNHPFIREDSESIFLYHALQLPPKVLNKAIRLQLEFDSKSALIGKEIPVLWVMGEYDQLYKSTLIDLKQYLPHVKYEEIKHAGHVAHVHQPEKFLFLFESFLRNDLGNMTKEVFISDHEFLETAM